MRASIEARTTGKLLLVIRSGGAQTNEIEGKRYNLQKNMTPVNFQMHRLLMTFLQKTCF